MRGECGKIEDQVKVNVLSGPGPPKVRDEETHVICEAHNTGNLS